MNLGIVILEYARAIREEKIHWWDNLVIQYIQELCWLAFPRPDQLKQPQIITLLFADLNRNDNLICLARQCTSCTLTQSVGLIQYALDLQACCSIPSLVVCKGYCDCWSAVSMAAMEPLKGACSRGPRWHPSGPAPWHIITPPHQISNYSLYFLRKRTQLHGTLRRTTASMFSSSFSANCLLHLPLGAASPAAHWEAPGGERVQPLIPLLFPVRIFIHIQLLDRKQHLKPLIRN